VNLVNEGPGQGRTIRWSLAGSIAVLAATAVACWPWWLPGRLVFGQRDSAFTILASHHLQQALLGQRPASVGPIGWPMPWSVTQADFTAGQGLLSLPLEAAGVEPFAAMGVVAFIGVLATAWCAQGLAASLMGPGPASWLAAVAAACHPLHLAHAQHVNLVHHEWMVCGALLLGWGLHVRSPSRALLGALALGVAPWFGLYMGLHAALVGALVLAAAALGRAGDRRSWAAAIGGLLLAVAAFSPVLTTYARAGFLFGVFTDPASLVAWSWDPSTTLAPLQRAPLHAWLFGASQGASSAANNPANPGYTVAALALLGLLTWRRRPGPRWAWWAVLAVLLTGAALALGPELVWRGQPTGVPGPYRLIDWLPGFYGLRDPVRWLGVAYTALGLLAGLGCWSLCRWVGRRGRPWAVGLALALLCLVVAERAVPRGVGPQQLRLDPAYLALDEHEGHGPMWDSALVKRPGEQRCRCDAARAYRAARYHGRPLVGATAARGIGTSRSMLRLLLGWPSPASVELLQAVGAELVLDHSGRTPDEALGAQCRQVQAHTLCTLPRRAPLPAPEDVSTDDGGPVVGLRWDRRLDSDPRIRCGEAIELHSAEVWRVVTELRHGAEPGMVEVFLDTPCAAEIIASPGGWTALRAGPDAAPWPAPWEGTGPGLTQAEQDMPARVEPRARPRPPVPARGRR